MTTTEPTRPRCSDADRERTASRLHEAVGAGYLSLAEGENRLTAAYGARHGDELESLVADLPAAVSPTSGWGAVLAAALAQAAADGRVMLGRTPAPDRRRRLLLTLVALLVAVGLLVGTVALAAHGMADGPEHHLGPLRSA